MMEDSMKDMMDEYLPLRDVVFRTLRRAILKGELKPGERLMEVQLANRLGVSRTPVREAIRKLELEGLVPMIPRRGAEVAEITEKNMRDVLEVRRALEELAVKIACEKMTDEEIELLRQASKKFRDTMYNDNLTAIAENDVEFHEIIYDATGNKRLIQILNNLREQMYRYRVEYLKDYNCHGILADEHDEIVEALERRDQATACRAIVDHINNQEMSIINSIKEKQE